MKEIENLRDAINKIDSDIYNLLKKRKVKAVKIGLIKKNKKLPVIDKAR